VTDAGPSADARPANCFGPLPGLGNVIDVCLDQRPSGAIAIRGIIDTDECAVQNTRAVEVGLLSFCVLSAGEINVTERVTASGGRPFMLLASESITIFPGAGIDASSYAGASAPGAGAIASSCANLDPLMSTGGGAGGTNQGRGGPGGNSAGVPEPTNRALAFMGGCPGGKGGNAIAPGGRGGGAIYVSAPSVDIRGILLASGEGGGVALSDNIVGGGGGGAGGYIGVYGASVRIDLMARLVAAGGGGGAGRAALGSVANPGQTATDVDPVANGGTVGTAGPQGATGGNGSDPIDGSEGGYSPDFGGGGGGGGAGYIDVRANGATIECVAPQCVPAVAL
jgi:hypothetical protein